MVQLRYFHAQFQPVTEQTEVTDYNAIQAVDDAGRILARASRVYDQWFYSIEGKPGAVLVDGSRAVAVAKIATVFQALGKRS